MGRSFVALFGRDSFEFNHNGPLDFFCSSIFGRQNTILSADTASEVRQLLSKSAENTLCILEHFCNADGVPQPPGGA